MQEKVDGVYQPLYPKTYWQQVIGADNQITTVNKRIDSVQASLQNQINNKQDASTAINQGNLKSYVNIVSGWYVGNGEANRTINLGFTPICVIIFPDDGIIFGGYPSYSPRTITVYGGMAVTGKSAYVSYDSIIATLVEIVTNGFNVHVLNACNDSSCNSASTNGNNITYYYLAVRQ
nr:MAG TPA: hypothetical protein [Caudoviricetes sp.]